MNDRLTQKDMPIENIVRLRRAERLSDLPVREDIASVREFLEDLVGPTVRPAQAARLLGLSQPALSHWMDKREVATVTTPEGRREIPLSELLELVEEVDQVRGEGVGRPVARVIRDRHRQAVEAIDLDRVLPRRGRGHRKAELQALAYHRVVADRLDEHLIDMARQRLRHWREEDRIHPRWADEWEGILSMPRPGIAKAISADDRHARALRQTSPFAGVLNEQ
ncbi:MAG: hypothetical protein WD380_04390, partial [Gaiellaceae bacterium]